MTEEKKHDDKDREKVSDEKLEDVDAGYAGAGMGSHFPAARKDKKRADSGSVDHNSSRSNNG